MTCVYCGDAKRIQIVSPVSDHAWADCFCVKISPPQQGVTEADREAAISVLKGLEILGERNESDLRSGALDYVGIVQAFMRHRLASLPAAASVEAGRWAGVPALVDQITAEEGATVTFVCPNPDFNGLPNECVTIVRGPTWQEETFRADTLADCLRRALTAKGKDQADG